jgi:hypothetical protein
VERWVSVARVAVGAAVGLLAFAGLAVSAQTAAFATMTLLVGGLGGVIVGVVVLGLNDRRPSGADVVRFVLGGIVTVAVLHAASLIGGPVLVVAAGLLVAWVALDQALQHLHRRRAEQARRAAAVAAARLSDLDISHLCELWERLRSASDTHARDARETEQLARVRQGLLDELERRSPGGFAAWIAAGADGDPSRYLV